MHFFEHSDLQLAYATLAFPVILSRRAHERVPATADIAAFASSCKSTVLSLDTTLRDQALAAIQPE